MEGGGLTEQDSVLRPASFREPDLDISDDKATVPSGMLFFSSKSHKQNQNKHIDSAQAQSRPGRFDAKSLGSPNFERNTTPRTEMGGSGEARYTDFMLGHLDRLNNFFEQGEESQRKGNGGGEGEGEGMEGSDTQSQQSSEDSEYRGEELGDDEESTSPVIAINTSSLGPGETTTVDGITYNSRGYEVCGQLNQHSKPCQRIGRCPFHGGKITPPPAAGKPRRHAVKKSPYKQGWTKEEHLRFLSGLQIHGKGAWKEIANIVGTRTPTQIQSHAQKYYLRQKQEVKNKRSIHDVSLSDLIKEDPAALEGGASPRKSDPGNKSQWSINNSRTKGRRGGGNLPYTSHMLLQPAASPLHFPSAQDAASSMGSLSQHSPSSSPSPSPTPALSGNSSPTPDPKAAMMGRYSPQLPLHPQHMHQRASSPYGMAAPPARVSSPMSFHPSNPGTFRPQPLSSYSPNTMRHQQQQQQQHQQHTMQPLHTASPTGDLVPSSNPPYMGPPGSNINNKNAGNGSPSGGYTSAMPPPGSNNGSSDQSNSNLLLAPMTTAFTPFIRPGRIGESNGGGYIFPHPSHRGSPEGNSVHGSTSNHDGTTNDNGADGGGGGEGKNHINGDMVELEIEMLRNRTRRLATPPPNTFQPIIAFHGGDPINVAHLLRPVHSPVPQIPPSSRLPPMSSTPPPSLMIQPPSQQQQQQQQQQQSPSSGMGVFPSSPSSGLTRSNLLSGNPYTSTGSSSQQSSFSLLNIPDGPNALPSSPFSSSSLLSPNSALPASSATSPQPFSLPTSPGLEGLKTESLSGSPKSDIHNLTTNGSMGFPLHYPPQPRDAISMQQPSNPGGEYLPHSVHSDFSPLMAASHPGRDSAEPVDDVQLLHPSAHGDEIREPSAHDQALTMQNFMRGTLAMLSGGAGSFSTPMNDDSEDEHVMGMEKEDAMPMPFSRKRRISDSASPFAHEGEASGHPRGTGDNGSGESDAKRAKGESTQGNAAPSAVTSDEHEEDTSSYFSSD